MAFTRVHHVGLITGDFDEARHVLSNGFGLSLDEHRTPWPEGRRGDYDGVTTLEFPIGEMYYEVSRPNDSISEAAEFLKSTNYKGGVYYLSIASDDIAKDVQRLTEHGLKLKNRDWDGASPIFLERSSSLGLGLQITPEDNYYVHPYYKGNGVVTGMAHIGIAARDAQEIRALWGEGFGLKEDSSSERGLAQPKDEPRAPADDPVHLIEFPLGGTVLEISIPLTEDSGTARLVAQRARLGATYHHTCPFTPDVPKFMKQATDAGLQQIGTLSTQDKNPLLIGWLHPKSCLGMLIEVWNRQPGTSHYTWTT